MDRSKTKKKLFFYFLLLWVALLAALYLSYGVYFVDTTSTKSKWVALFAGSIAIFCAACKMLETSFASSKKPLCEKITKYFSGKLPIPEKTDYGFHVLPDTACGAGPLYFRAAGDPGDFGRIYEDKWFQSDPLFRRQRFL